MPTDHRAELREIRTFPSLVRYLRDEMGWPIETDDFEELVFEYTLDELGIDARNAAGIQDIKRLRPLSPGQPWGIFFVKFEPKRLPVVALRRILSQVVLKRRASANSVERQAWAADDLLFVSNYGDGDDRRITFAHFSQNEAKGDLPTLKVLGWDNLDTPLHLDKVAAELTTHLAWPEHESDVEAWRSQWSAAFSLGHREVITTSRELSIRLAGLARAIRDRIKTAIAIETERGPLTKLMKAFQEALVHDLDAEGFADMYAQTIAYGLLSARIADPKANTADHLPAQIPVTNPFLKELMETFLQVGGRRGRAGGRGIDFDELGTSEVVDLLDDAKMEDVVRDFGDRNPQEDPVIHFYELFLKEYDAKKRMQRGVFYTPRPVVSYIVRSVDELLRTEFGLQDGLADTTTWGEMAARHAGLTIPEGTSPDQTFVQILDPACGTGTFLVEVIDVIHQTMKGKWEKEAGGPLLANVEERWNEYVPKHLLPRLHGYELLMAPYAIAHLKIGLKLYETGYRFGSDERARVYLTNALEPAQDFSGRLEFAIPALAHEAQAVQEIKEKQRFTVVVGNPPYAAVSSNLAPALRRIVDPYRSVDGQPIRERGMLQFEKNIQDDYVKFFSLSQATLTQARSGICSLISNHSYLDGPTLRGMRWNLISCFPRSWFLDLHGNANKAEVPPRGVRDENVFDIRQGVAICLLVKSPDHRLGASISVGDFWGEREDKYQRLASANVRNAEWTRIESKPPYYYLIKPDSGELGTEWKSWPAICDFFTKRSTGTETGFDRLLVGFTKSELLQQVALFADPSVSRQSLSQHFDISEGHASELFDRRRELRNLHAGDVGQLQLRAFDYRWALLRRDLLKTNSFNVMLDLDDQSPGLVTTRQTKERFSAFAARGFCGHKIASSYDRSYVLPLFTKGSGDLISEESICLDRSWLAWFSDMHVEADGHTPGHRELALTIFNYALALLNAPSYSTRFGERLKRDWPRLPLPRSLAFFRTLADVGRDLAAIQMMASAKLARPITEYVGGRAREVERVSWSTNTVWLDKAKTTGFRGVREEVWNFHIGGYQVCEKWLTDRKGRTLSDEDIVHYQKIVVALSETIRIRREIDEVIEAHGGWPAAFQAGQEKVVPFTLTPPPVQGQLFDQRPGDPVPSRPRIVEPQPEERYVTRVPLVPLKAAAGAFGDPQHVEDGEFEWVEVHASRHLRPGMFVAQVVGQSMEPTIPDGAYCLFRAPVEGTRQGKTVLVQLRDQLDPETGERYTVKRYESAKIRDGDTWRHETIALKPINPNFEPIVLKGDVEGQLQVVAEFLEVLIPPVTAPPAATTAVSGRAAGEIAHSKGSDGRAAAEEPVAEDDEEEPRERIDAAQLDRDELICRIRQLFSDGSPREREQAITQMAEGLGYERVGSKVREIVDNSLRTAVRRGVLTSDGGGLRLDVRSIEDYRRDFLKEQFLASFEGRAWKQRGDAIRDLARWLGFRRTGRVINQTLRSIINGLLREGRLDSSGALIRRSG